MFFPPDTDEDLEEIKPFLNDLPILQSVLLEGEDHNDVKAFLGEENLGVEVLHPENLINKSIFPLHRKSDKPCVMENRLHMRYIFKVWDKLSGHQHRNLRKEISETPILWAYNGGQPETFDFVKPRAVYLPEAYTGDADLETYFSVYDGDIWFLDHAYMEVDSDRKDWLQFLKAIGSIDTPQVDKVEVVGSYKECEERGITWQRSTREFENGSFIDRYYSGHFDGAIEDFEFVGLLEVFNQISDHNKVNLSRSLWNLLIEAIGPLSPEKKSRWPWTSSRDAFFQCTYRWFYKGPKEGYFDATFCRQLKKTAWLPDEQGNLHRPSELFAPTDDNRRVLGDSVAYLYPDFDVNQDNETARWLAEKLGIHLNANTDSVINYLQTLSGTEISVEKVEPLYRFLARQDARRSEEFKQKPLIFTSNSEPRWWRSDEVFWEDESPVFGNRRGYLKENYADYEGTLKPFFRTLDVSERAAPSDYVEVIQEVASVERSENAEVRDRVEALYRRIMPYLQEDGGSPEDEKWQKAWKRTSEGRCWLGKKGDKWGFFFFHRLVWRDDHYRSGLFKEEIPFWAFDNDLEFAKYLGVKGCYEVSDVEFNYHSDQGEDQIWSEKVRNLYPYIYDFLNSPRLCEQYGEEQAAEILKRLSVHQAHRLEVRYRLNGISLTDPNPRQSFLDTTGLDQGGTLWLGLETDEGVYPDLIGDALQDYFVVNQLREFVKDLLLTTEPSGTTLLSWERRGFQPDRCLSPPEPDSEEGNENVSESVDEELPDEKGVEDYSGTDDSEVETPAVHEKPETGNGDNDSETNDSGTPRYQPRPGGSGTRPRGRNRSSTSNGGRGTGHSSGRSDSTEDNTHIDETDTSLHIRKEIERIGMEHARRYEEEQGHTVEDVSAENLGFDLRSTTPNGEIRCIEVKARAERALVVLTSNEWDTAEQLKDSYFLYVVLNAKTQPEHYIIQNPTDKVAVDERYEVRYQVPLSEITEHGISV